MSDLEDRIYSWLLKKSRNSASGNVRAGASMVGLCQDVINDPIEVRKSLDKLRSESPRVSWRPFGLSQVTFAACSASCR